MSTNSNERFELHVLCESDVYFAYCIYIGCGETSWNNMLFVELVEAMTMQPKIVRSRYHNYSMAYTAEVSRFQFLRAQDLMKTLTGFNSRSEFQLLTPMSKVYIRKALECESS